VDIALAAAGVTGIKVLLLKYARIPTVWLPTIEWLLFALLLWIIVSWSNSRGKSQLALMRDPSSMVLAANNESREGNFDAPEFFRRAYVSSAATDAENNIRASNTGTSPEEREEFYLKILGLGTVAVIYDDIWWTIYRSQILALLELNQNSGSLPLAKFKKYYDDAKETYPAEYAKDPFHQWMLYLERNSLILVHPNEMIVITVRGKDFLKYLVHWGRSADTRSL
jgi:hypothetical protein